MWKTSSVVFDWEPDWLAPWEEELELPGRTQEREFEFENFGRGDQTNAFLTRLLGRVFVLGKEVS